MTIMPTLSDLHGHLILSQQIQPSVPGVIPLDKSTDPNLTYWIGAIWFVISVATALAYLLGIKSPFVKSDPGAQVASTAAAKAAEQKPYDPSASMYWDATLNGIFDGIKRCEAHLLAITGGNSSLREAVLRAAAEARHGVSEHLQRHIAAQERQHDENSRALEGLSQEVTGAVNQLSNQLAGLSGQINALAVTLGKIETLSEGSTRRSSR